MEQVVIQSNSNYQAVVDNYVRGVCDHFHVDNYYATIFVPVLNIVESALAQVPAVSLNHTCTSQGLRFSVQADQDVFSSFSADSISDSSLLLRLLVDDYCVESGGMILSMSFSVLGIDPSLSQDRIHSMQRYSSPTPTLSRNFEMSKIELG